MNILIKREYILQGEIMTTLVELGEEMRFLTQINEFIMRIQTIGQVAAQEQMRIIEQYIDNILAGYKRRSLYLYEHK